MKKILLYIVFITFMFVLNMPVYAKSNLISNDNVQLDKTVEKYDNYISLAADDSHFNNVSNFNHNMVMRGTLSKYFIGALKSHDQFVNIEGYRNRNTLKFNIFDNDNQEFKEIMKNTDFLEEFPGMVIVNYAPYLSKDGIIYMVVRPVLLTKEEKKLEDKDAGLYSYNINTEKLTLIMKSDVMNYTPIVHEEAVYFITSSDDSEAETKVRNQLVRYSLKDKSFTVYDKNVMGVISANREYLYSLKNEAIYQLSHKTGRSELLIDLKHHELTKDFKAKGPFQVTDEYIFLVLNAKYSGISPLVPMTNDVVARVEISSGKVKIITPDTDKIYSIRSLNTMNDNCFFIADEINDELKDILSEYGHHDAAEKIKAKIYQGDSKGNVHVIGETHGVDLIIDGERLYYSDKGYSDVGIESTFKFLKIMIK